MARQEVAVLEFGSSKISVLVAVRGVNNTFKIIAHGSSDYAGFSDGEFLEPEQLSDAVAVAKSQAEGAYGKKITKLFVGVPSEFCCVKVETLNASLKKRTKIKSKHIEALFALSSNEYGEHIIINKTPIYFLLDDGNKILDPIGLTSLTLQVEASYLLVEKQFFNFIDNILCGLGVYKTELIGSALAMSLYLIEPQLRQNGAVLIDCGFITTSVNSVLFEGVVDLKSFSLGGGHITADLMEVLKISFDNAEQLKRKVMLSIAPTSSDFYEIVVNGKLQKFSMKIVNEICMARIDNIVDAIKTCFASFKTDVENLDVFITGGGLCYIKGISNYLSLALNKNIKIATSNMMQYNKPDLSSELSLIDVALNIAGK